MNPTFKIVHALALLVFALGSCSSFNLGEVKVNGISRCRVLLSNDFEGNRDHLELLFKNGIISAQILCAALTICDSIHKDDQNNHAINGPVEDSVDLAHKEESKHYGGFIIMIDSWKKDDLLQFPPTSYFIDGELFKNGIHKHYTLNVELELPEPDFLYSPDEKISRSKLKAIDCEPHHFIYE